MTHFLKHVVCWNCNARVAVGEQPGSPHASSRATARAEYERSAGSEASQLAQLQVRVDTLLEALDESLQRWVSFASYCSGCQTRKTLRKRRRACHSQSVHVVGIVGPTILQQIVSRLQWRLSSSPCKVLCCLCLSSSPACCTLALCLARAHARTHTHTRSRCICGQEYSGRAEGCRDRGRHRRRSRMRMQ
jgi:hypothetical protein